MFRKKSRKKCVCIRCREASLKEAKSGIVSSIGNAKLQRMDYDASNGKEIFLSFEDAKTDSLFGFCRLRIPSSPFRKEISTETGLVRELHVYSPVLDLGEESEMSFQHKGFGKQLMLEAEKIAGEEFDCKKMVVISGIGVREYYRRFFNYKNDGPFVSKAIE